MSDSAWLVALMPDSTRCFRLMPDSTWLQHLRQDSTWLFALTRPARDFLHLCLTERDFCPYTGQHVICFTYAGQHVILHLRQDWTLELDISKLRVGMWRLTLASWNVKRASGWNLYFENEWVMQLEIWKDQIYNIILDNWNCKSETNMC